MWLTAGISRPRAATSEATSSVTSPLRNDFERGGARRLIEVAVQRGGVELVLQQRAVQLRDFALAVAEHDGVLEAVGGADQPAQRLALVGRIAAGRDLAAG